LEGEKGGGTFKRWRGYLDTKQKILIHWPAKTKKFTTGAFDGERRKRGPSLGWWGGKQRGLVGGGKDALSSLREGAGYCKKLYFFHKKRGKEKGPTS